MLPADLINYVIDRESGGDPNARNPRSSAQGAGQFIDGTWQDLVQRYPNDLTPDGRTDPGQARRAVELYAKDNASALQNAGYEPSQDNLYLAHRFGPSGATSLLGYAPETPMAQAVSPEVLKANPDLMSKTVGQVTKAQPLQAPMTGMAPQLPPGAYRNEQGGPQSDQAQPLQAPMTGMAPQLSQSGMQTVIPAQRAQASPSLWNDPQGWFNHPDAGRKIQSIAASVRSLSDPEAAKVMAANIDRPEGQWTSSIDSNGNVFRINKATGQVDTIRDPNFVKKVPETAIAAVSKEATAASGASYVASRIGQTLDDLKAGRLKLNPGSNLVDTARNMAGFSNDESRAYSNYQQLLSDMQNQRLLEAKGVQTEGDASRALAQFTAGAAGFDRTAMTQSLENILQKARNDIDRSKAVVETHKSQYGGTTFKPFEDKINDYAKSIDAHLATAADTKAVLGGSPKSTSAAGGDQGDARSRLSKKYGLEPR